MPQLIHHLSSINHALKQSEKLIGESKELIRRSRSLRALSQEQVFRSAKAMSRPDSMSEQSKEIVRHLLDSREKKLFLK